MNRWHAFNAVCGQLRAGLLGGRSLDRQPRVRWEELIEISSSHCVTPVLAWCLQDKAYLPADVRGYFDAILSLNSTRNACILDGLARVVTALNAIDIEPVLLKGAAHLVEGLYPAPGLRVVGDVDILVPEDRAKSAAAALQCIGFVVSAVNLPETHHHLPGMRDSESGLYVELHTRVDLKEAVVSAGWFREKTRPFPFRGLQIHLPEPTRSIGHNVVHSQLNHEGYQANRIELRQLLDLAMIRARHEGAIDWAELDHRFCHVGQGQVLSTYLHFADVLLGQPAPQLRCAPRKGAMTDLCRQMEASLFWRFRRFLQRQTRLYRALVVVIRAVRKCFPGR